MTEKGAEGNHRRGQGRVGAEKVGEEGLVGDGEVEERVEGGNYLGSNRAEPIEVGRGVRGARAETTAFVRAVRSGVGEDHVVGEGEEVEGGVRGYPGEEKGKVMDKVVSLDGSKVGSSAAFVDVGIVFSVELGGRGRGTRREVEGKVMVSDLESHNAVGGDAHGPRAVVALSRTGAS